ncbi:hypothetical protein N657DRAFT_649315 [Parathielavia appendiculata]|uniref:Uncharacterized protein n=1 Tax=Parathielavia appendiculata TaxID=2587402 RepID=A0AAN6Z0D8_9PEZI|nr:hypothetical protein N657DRAFT_649315 [Parathielavia appendiculata]
MRPFGPWPGALPSLPDRLLVIGSSTPPPSMTTALAAQQVLLLPATLPETEHQTEVEPLQMETLQMKRCRRRCNSLGCCTRLGNWMRHGWWPVGRRRHETALSSIYSPTATLTQMARLRC